MKISIITTCKGRLSHLKKTLPRMMFQWDINSKLYEVIVVDYGDPDNSFSWAFTESQKLNFNNLISIKVLDNIQQWNPGRARNIGSQHATGKLLFFVDADILLDIRDVKRVLNVFSKSDCVIWRRDVFRKGGSAGSFNGTFACLKKSFNAVRGFNELGVGWCGEDIDLYRRMECFKKTEIIKDGDLKYNVIRHGGNLRTTFSGYDHPRQNRDAIRGFFRQTINNVNQNGWGRGKVKILHNTKTT